MVLVALAYLGVLAASLAELRRAASWRDLAPTLGLVGLQALWFSLPVLARATTIGIEYEPLGIRYAEYTFYWIAFGHFTQYLWITLYYARSTGAARGSLPYLTRTLLVGSAIWGIPLGLFSPDVLTALTNLLGPNPKHAHRLHCFLIGLEGYILQLRRRRSPRPIGCPNV